MQPPLGRPRAVDRVEQARQGAVVSFLDQASQTRRVADQASRRFEHRSALDLAQAIILERRSRTRQIDDRVGDPQTRVKLKRAVGIDDAIMIDSVFAKTGAGEIRIFRRDPKRLARLFELGRQIDEIDQMRDVDPAFGHGDDKPAAAVAQVANHDRDVEGFLRAFGEDVKAGDAQLAAPFLSLRDDVAGTHEDDVESRMTGDGRLVLAIAGAANLVACGFQKLDDAVVEVAFRRDRQADGVVGSHGRSSSAWLSRSCEKTFKGTT